MLFVISFTSSYLYCSRNGNTFGRQPWWPWWRRWPWWRPRITTPLRRPASKPPPPSQQQQQSPVSPPPEFQQQQTKFTPPPHTIYDLTFASIYLSSPCRLSCREVVPVEPPLDSMAVAEDVVAVRHQGLWIGWWWWQWQFGIKAMEWNGMECFQAE